MSEQAVVSAVGASEKPPAADMYTVYGETAYLRRGGALGYISKTEPLYMVLLNAQAILLASGGDEREAVLIGCTDWDDDVRVSFSDSRTHLMRVALRRETSAVKDLHDRYERMQDARSHLSSAFDTLIRLGRDDDAETVGAVLLRMEVDARARL